MPIIFSETVIDDLPVIAVRGRIDSGTAKECEDYLLGHVADGRSAMVIDLGEVDYVSSAGLRVLVMAAKRAMRLGLGFVLCRLQEDVAEVVEISGLTDILSVHAGAADAVAALKG